jgi:hypothetical protein
MFLILFVLHDNGIFNEILTAWDEAGVSGVTILPSTGLARLRSSLALRDDMPIFPSLEDFEDRQENQNRTLFTVVPTEEMVDKVVAATQEITGDLNQPNTGILVVLPVLKAYGLHRKG